MNATDCARLSTDELVRRFAEAAKRAGCYFSGSWGFPSRRTPESKQADIDIQPIGAELKARKPVAKLRELFDDPSIDVRFWAGAQFVGIDPEWATAALNGVYQNLTTREVLDLRSRVLAGPPPHPALESMSEEELVAYFEDASCRCYASTRFIDEEEGGGESNMTAWNATSTEIGDIARELRDRGSLTALLPLLDHRFVTVRQKAAIYCRPVAAERAIAVLEAIASSQDWPDHSCAYRALENWRGGNSPSGAAG